MTSSVAKIKVALAGCIGLFGASTAYGANSVEVAVAANGSTTSLATRIESGIAHASIIAANQRETNLQKTATFVIVSGIDSARQHRSPR